MVKPLASLLSFGNFAKVSSPFFQRALWPFIESSKRSEGQEKELPMMAEVVAKTQKEALPQGVGIGSLPSPSSLSLFLPFFFTLFALVSADTGAKDP